MPVIANIIYKETPDHNSSEHELSPSPDYCLSLNSSEEVCSQPPGGIFNSTAKLQIFPSFDKTRTQSIMLKECVSSVQPSWNHDDRHTQTPHSFASSETFAAPNNESDIRVEIDQQQPTDLNDGGNILDTNAAVTSGHEFLDFYDIFPGTYDLYDGNELNLADLKDSNAYFNDLLQYNQCNGNPKTSSISSSIITDQTTTESRNAYPTHAHESESYLPMGRSDTSECQSHTIETPSPDFFTLPSASSSSTYSMDSSVLNSVDGLAPINSSFTEATPYTKCDEIRFPPTSMPVLVRFNTNTPARQHGENDIEVEQAVASIVDLDAEGNEEATKKDSEQSSSIQTGDETKSDEKLPILSPMNTGATNLSEPVTSIASNSWAEHTMTGSTADIDWEIWDSLDLPGCDYTDGDVHKELPVLKPNDLLSSLDPYLLGDTSDSNAFDMDLPEDVCQHVQSSQQQQQQSQYISQPVMQQVISTDEAIVLPVTVSVAADQAKPASLMDSKATKFEGGSSRPRRSTDCLNGSLPLHLCELIFHISFWLILIKSIRQITIDGGTYVYAHSCSCHGVQYQWHFLIYSKWRGHNRRCHIMERMCQTRLYC